MRASELGSIGFGWESESKPGGMVKAGSLENHYSRSISGVDRG